MARKKLEGLWREIDADCRAAGIPGPDVMEFLSEPSQAEILSGERSESEWELYLDIRSNVFCGHAWRSERDETDYTDVPAIYSAQGVCKAAYRHDHETGG